MNAKQPITLWTDGANCTADRLRRRTYRRFCEALLIVGLTTFVTFVMGMALYGWIAL